MNKSDKRGKGKLEVHSVKVTLITGHQISLNQGAV